MVLAELGDRLSNALKRMRSSTVIDKAVLDELLKEVGDALLSADVHQRMVVTLKVNVTRAVRSQEAQPGANKRQLIEKAMVQELGKLLDPGVPPYQPKKRQSSVFMFVGLQGAGKTTSVTKMAYYYQRKGWSVGLVCADTFRAGAFDQLKQNATKAGIPFFGSYTERDPVVVATEGVERFRADKTEIIIVDTSGRHKQEEALFEEMRAISQHIEPDDTIFVMDSSIGQAAKEQAEAFASAVDVGSIIITKLDGHAKGGGAISAVASTKSPIIFIGTGEQIDKLEKFSAASYVSRLLGKWDIAGIMDLWKDAKGDLDEKETVKKLIKGKFKLRDMRDQFQTVLNMGPGLLNMIPGLSKMMPTGGEEASQKRIKQFMTIMDSMTNEELDGEPKMFTDSRKMRIARGAGVHPQRVTELLQAFKPFQQMGGNLGKMMKQAGSGNMDNMSAAQMEKVLPPQALKNLGGRAGLNQMLNQMKAMEANGEMDPDKMGDMMKKMQQMAGGMGMGQKQKKIRVRRKWAGDVCLNVCLLNVLRIFSDVYCFFRSFFWSMLLLDSRAMRTDR